MLKGKGQGAGTWLKWKLGGSPLVGSSEQAFAGRAGNIHSIGADEWADQKGLYLKPRTFSSMMQLLVDRNASRP